MEFNQRVLLACKQIPYGQVATYGQIAFLCGKPRCPRQVGFALNRKADGSVPAHRVINSRGYLSGAQAFLGENLQKALLESEGVLVSEDNCVELGLFGWRPSLEETDGLNALFVQHGI